MVLVYRGVDCPACKGDHTLYNPDPGANCTIAVYGYQCPETGLAVVLRPPPVGGVQADPPPGGIPLRWVSR